jgi:hypothetical protein
VLFRKLIAVARQQYIGLIALFVALGGSAYAAATINSGDVVNDSLTGGDVRGRAAKPGKPFTQGSLTGADVLGSPGVNGGLSGFDVANESIRGIDVQESTLGPVPSAASVGGVVESDFSYSQPVQTALTQVFNGDGYRIEMGCPTQGTPTVNVNATAAGNVIIATYPLSNDSNRVISADNGAAQTTDTVGLSAYQFSNGTSTGTLVVRAAKRLTTINWAAVGETDGFGETGKRCFFFGHKRVSNL